MFLLQQVNFNHAIYRNKKISKNLGKCRRPYLFSVVIKSLLCVSFFAEI